MSGFCSDQGRKRVFGPRKAEQEGVRLYTAAGNPRRTPIRTKRAVSEWALKGHPAGNTQKGISAGLPVEIQVYLFSRSFIRLFK